MRQLSLALAGLLAAALPGAASAQVPARPGVPGSAEPVVTRTPGTTGNDRNVVVVPGPTGASTLQTDSAAAGNAGQPARAVPQGSGGGSR
jgi:hypothetical protein